MECNTTHLEITATGKPKLSYLLIQRAINISTVDGGIERKVLPVLSFKVFEVRVAGRAVPEKKQPNKRLCSLILEEFKTMFSTTEGIKSYSKNT